MSIARSRAEQIEPDEDTRATEARHPSSLRADALPTPALKIAPKRRTQTGADRHHEQFLGLVQRVFFAPGGSADVVRSVMCANIDIDRDGSGEIAAAAAELLAWQVSGRVCLVDADFRSPSLHRRYGVKNDRGLSDGLVESLPMRSYAQRLMRPHESSLWFMPAGSVTGDHRRSTLPAGPDRLRELIDAFDVVVINGPAVTRDPMAQALAASVDGVILVAEANATRRTSARAAVEALRVSGARVLGGVLNSRTFPIPDALYRLI